jgi:AraC-like DNA-binding protein
LIGAYAPHDGRFALRIPGVYAIRASRPNTELVHTVWQPGLCIVAQGAKRVMLGQSVYEYGVPRAQEVCAMYVGQTDAQIVNAATRLVELVAQPGDAELLAPLVIDEIIIRLLRSPGGARVAQLGLAESRVHKVAKALAWLRAHFAEPMTVAALAKAVHLSASAFHQHFKAVTSMSPLQFQKVLRLQEARRLMLSMMMDVSTASQRVGYFSVSQFSREYNRFFGSSPTKDVARVRDHMVSGGTQFPL